jgi:hypothetical protein
MEKNDAFETSCYHVVRRLYCFCLPCAASIRTRNIQIKVSVTDGFSRQHTKVLEDLTSRTSIDVSIEDYRSYNYLLRRGEGIKDGIPC